MNAQIAPSGWTLQGDRLVRTISFASFVEAIAFMVKVSFYCDKECHHPEWKNVYNKLIIELTTHDIGGVSDKDYKLARHINLCLTK